jgi:hypothetical protein
MRVYADWRGAIIDDLSRAAQTHKPACFKYPSASAGMSFRRDGFR